MGTGMCEVLDCEHAIQFTGRRFDYHTIATEKWSLKNLNGTSKNLKYLNLPSLSYSVLFLVT